MSWKRVLKGLAVWVPTVVFGLFFVMQGVMKLQPASPWEGRFAEWGFPAWFLIVVGVMELAGGIGLFVPRVSAYAALTLAVTMVGALGTHVVHAEWINVGATFVFTLIFLALARARWSRAAGVGETTAVLASTAE
jgi:putative oxidoreductase